MTKSCSQRFACTLLLGGLLAACTPAQRESREAAQVAQEASALAPVVRWASRVDTTKPLRELPEIVWNAPSEIVKPPRILPGRQGSFAPWAPDPVLQAVLGDASAPTAGVNFEGINNVNAVLPPDTNGDVGPNHYVQNVNLSFAVWDRNGTKLYGPVNMNTLWQGFGGPCETNNDGDPIVLYNHADNRWMQSQFALPNFPRGPFYQCIAVSQTGDPTGAYHRYEFKIHDSKLNDYPKFGKWWDALYVAVNQFICRGFGGCSWAGQGVVAFEWAKMILGQAARMVYFDLFNVDSNLGGMLPSDFNGPAPSSTKPNYFIQVDDDAWGYSPDQLQVWKFKLDWNNTANSSFTFDKALTTAAFDSNLCGYSRNCIPQPGGTNVDAISDRLMYRLQYRKFADRETLVVNHTVDVNGSDRAGIRWYELRDTGSGWGIHQQGTYSPDSNHRWMGSVAMNSAGDIALGYSVSSTSVYPSIRVTGRLDGETLGLMTQGELEIRTGSGYQTHSSGRWGDYSMMGVDPVDDCTFWYTQEYYAVVGTAPWQTRIGSFKLRNCPAATPECTTAADCADDGNPCTVTACENGKCVHNPGNSGAVCRPAAGECDVAETCDGMNAACPADGFALDGTPCTGGICCGGTCTAPACTSDANCADAEVCTADTCTNPGSCSAACTNTWPACGLSDGCCGPACSGGNDVDCPSCSPVGASCVSDSECCSLKCRGRSGAKTCKG